MKSIPKHSLGTRLLFIIGLFSLFWNPAVKAQEWKEHPSFASSYYGRVYHVLLDEKGHLGSLVHVVSATDIKRGSYGMDLGDFDNDGPVDYLITQPGG